ncbi:MAG: hypothetical protein ACLRK9_08440 [Roseburia hominis]
MPDYPAAIFSKSPAWPDVIVDSFPHGAMPQFHPGRRTEGVPGAMMTDAVAAQYLLADPQISSRKSCILYRRARLMTALHRYRLYTESDTTGLPDQETADGRKDTHAQIALLCLRTVKSNLDITSVPSGPGFHPHFPVFSHAEGFLLSDECIQSDTGYAGLFFDRRKDLDCFSCGDDLLRRGGYYLSL